MSQKALQSQKAPQKSDGLRVVVVDEMGFLLELYSQVDWAYVGGGFGDGVHSTIEPAIYGLPISCGPHGSGKFPEISQLAQAGQLRIVRDSDEVEAWFNDLGAISADARAEWRKQAEGRTGATQRIHQVIASLLAHSEGS